MTQSKEEAFAFLKAEAVKRGKTYEEFLNTDIKPMLEKAWEIQQRTGKPVSLDQLLLELNEEVISI